MGLVVVTVTVTVTVAVAVDIVSRCSTLSLLQCNTFCHSVDVVCAEPPWYSISSEIFSNITVLVLYDYFVLCHCITARILD